MLLCALEEVFVLSSARPARCATAVRICLFQPTSADVTHCLQWKQPGGDTTLHKVQTYTRHHRQLICLNPPFSLRSRCPPWSCPTASTMDIEIDSPSEPMLLCTASIQRLKGSPIPSEVFKHPLLQSDFSCAVGRPWLLRASSYRPHLV